MTTLLELKDVHFSYRERQGFFRFPRIPVCRGVTFDVVKGESVGIIGRNGAGKSTLLKLLAGILDPDEGSIVRKTSQVSLLTLGSGFDGRLAGRFNVVLTGMLLGFSRSQVLEKLPDIVDFSGLGEAIDRPVRTYSSGMRARLGFSIANILEPDLLLIDEVLGVGDREFREKSRTAMRRKIEAGQTIVLVSHNPASIKRLCSRAVWIENGKTMAWGDSEDVVDQYERSVIESDH